MNDMKVLISLNKEIRSNKQVNIRVQPREDQSNLGGFPADSIQFVHISSCHFLPYLTSTNQLLNICQWSLASA